MLNCYQYDKQSDQSVYQVQTSIRFQFSTSAVSHTYRQLNIDTPYTYSVFVSLHIPFHQLHSRLTWAFFLFSHIQVLDSTEIATMSMNNYPVDEGYRNMLNSFRYNDLQTLLEAFGRSKTGQITELKDRAIELLRTRPANVNYSAYLAKIHEIYSSLLRDMPSNDIMLQSLSQNPQQQTQMMSSLGPIQIPPQRMYQPLQYPQQSMYALRARLPQVMPQMPRGVYRNRISNSLSANNMVNYNSQYIVAGNYQLSGSRTIVSHQLPPNQRMNIAAQNLLELGTTASGNNPYAPSIETVAQIKFKKPPFYEVIDEVIKPTLLTGTESCTLQNVPKDTKENTFKFTLSLEQSNFVAEHRYVSREKYVYPYQLQIRICQLVEPVPNESLDYMPLELHIRIGMKACPLPPPVTYNQLKNKPRRIASPINCTENFKLSPIVNNKITINWTPDGKNYVFALHLVKKLTVDTLIQRLQDNGGRSSEETKNYIIKTLEDVDSDLATTFYRVSLVCPISKMKIKIPVKSIHCDHLQCFDASTFILMNEKKPTWNCPTCNKSCLYDDLQIENYILEVLSSPLLKNCNKEIDVFADGTWGVYEEIKETINTNSTPDNVNYIDFVDLDSDEENCDEQITEQVVIEIDRPSPPSSPNHTTEAS